MTARFSNTRQATVNGTRFTVAEIRALIDNMPADTFVDVDQERGYNQLDGTTTTLEIEGTPIQPTTAPGRPDYVSVER